MVHDLLTLVCGMELRHGVRWKDIIKVNAAAG
jgi:hypothetical protein